MTDIAARTTTIRLFTGVTTLSLLDPVRAFEDCATLDHLSDGRLELIIGKGNGAAQKKLFHVTTAKGTDFRPGPRVDLDEVVHVNHW